MILIRKLEQCSMLGPHGGERETTFDWAASSGLSGEAAAEI
jgi:hypothetical protein